MSKKMQKFWSRFCLTTLCAIAVGTPAWGQVNLYGAVGDLWGDGFEAAEADDFEAALGFYHDAIAASSSLTDDHLQDCAWVGSVARAASMAVAIAYLDELGTTPAAIAEAHDVAAYAFAAAFEELHEQYPHLENSCP